MEKTSSLIISVIVLIIMIVLFPTVSGLVSNLIPSSVTTIENVLVYAPVPIEGYMVDDAGSGFIAMGVDTFPNLWNQNESNMTGLGSLVGWGTPINCTFRTGISFELSWWFDQLFGEGGYVGDPAWEDWFEYVFPEGPPVTPDVAVMSLCGFANHSVVRTWNVVVTYDTFYPDEWSEYPPYYQAENYMYNETFYKDLSGNFQESGNAPITLWPSYPTIEYRNITLNDDFGFLTLLINGGYGGESQNVGVMLFDSEAISETEPLGMDEQEVLALGVPASEGFFDVPLIWLGWYMFTEVTTEVPNAVITQTMVSLLPFIMVAGIVIWWIKENIYD